MEILITIFLILGIMALVIAYIPIIKDTINKKKNKKMVTITCDGEVEIAQKLKDVSSSNNYSKVAEGFIALLNCHYILLHILKNKGNKYKDKKQMESFCNSLNSEVVRSLKIIEGKYE